MESRYHSPQDIKFCYIRYMYINDIHSKDRCCKRYDMGRRNKKKYVAGIFVFVLLALFFSVI